MYREEHAKLRELGRSGPDGFNRIATFVLCTIRMPFYTAVADYKLVRDGHPARSIFGVKHKGLAFLRDHDAETHVELEYLFETCASEDAMLRVVTRIPGIGLAKGGFILQMIYGVSGCIDTYNLQRFGLDDQTFQAKGNWKRLHALVPAYNEFCRKVGGTARLWDDWCAYVSDRDSINYPSAEYVSRLHLTPLEC